MEKRNGNKRRENLGYKYDVFEEVSHYPRSSDLGERVNIFLTEITRISTLLKLTVSVDDRDGFVFLGEDKIKAILSHTKYKSILQDLNARRIIKRQEKTNRYGSSVYMFDPVYYRPILQGIPIRNLKVRNGVRRYLGIQGERVSPEVHKWIRPALVSTEIRITEEEFFSDLDNKYSRYKTSKLYKGERPRSLESYRQDLGLTFYAIRQFQQLNRTRRAGYIREDNFSGRVYNIATGVPRFVRSYIRIQGEPVAEIDMRSSHAVLLWKIVPRTDFITFLTSSTSRGLDIYDRLGEILGINERREVKFKFLRALYSRPSSRYSQDFKRIFPQAAEILEGIKSTENKRNPSNGRGTHTNLAFKLLNLEVKLFRQVWEGLYLEGIPFLSIHDGVLVPVSQVARARGIMEAILRREIPIVETKTIFY
jgi:hypothetical protein